MSKATRFNEGKPSLAYILQFVKPIEAIARIMELGAIKYDDGNWRKGGKPDSEYLNSMMRHLTEWIHGNVYDKDSGCSHLGHAIWNLLALHELNHPDEIVDDELFKDRCAYWKAKKAEKSSSTPIAIDWDVNTFHFDKNECPAEKANKGISDEVHKLGSYEYLKQLHKWEEDSKDVVIEVGGEICGENNVPKNDDLATAIVESVVAPDAPHPSFCACDACMDGPGRFEFKNTWGLPAIEVFTEDGEKRAKEICGENDVLTDEDKVEGHEEFKDKMAEIVREGLLAGPSVQEWSNALERINGGKYPTMEELAAAHNCVIPAEYCDDEPPLEESVTLAVIEPADWQVEEVQEVRDDARDARATALSAARTIGKSLREEIKRTPKQDKGQGPACPECGKATFSGGVFGVIGGTPGCRYTWTCEGCDWWDYKAPLCLTKKTACSDEGVCEECLVEEDTVKIEFTLDDVNRCESFSELVDKYIRPAIVSQALERDISWLQAHQNFFAQLVTASKPPKKHKTRNLLEGAPVTPKFQCEAKCFGGTCPCEDDDCDCMEEHGE
jgi:hypothetical protein